MTKILKLEMKGFKTFGKKTEIPFGDHFNVVLGPNGSGKSNILDSICFVLGKAGSKGLRAEKTANLIYNGGKTKNPAKEGEVSIYFDNSTKEFPIPESVLKITRIIQQNGQSHYKINDKKRTREQILDLLSAARINPDGYNIVLQGDIIRFIDMSPETRRQVIEEIAGISVYEEKKQKALSELDKVEQKLKESDIVLAERQTHLKQLQTERDQALRYRELIDKIKQHKASYHYIRMQGKLKEKEKFDRQIEEKNKEIAEAQKEINQAKNQILEKKEEIKKISKEIEDKGDKEQNRIQREVEQLKVDIASNKTRVESLKNEMQKIKQRKEQLKSNSEEIDTKTTEASKKQEELLLEKQKNDKERDFIAKKLEDFRKKNQLGQTESIDGELTSLDKEVDEKQKEIQRLREEQQNLLREKDRLEYQLQTLDERIDKVLSVEKTYQKEIEVLKQKKQEFKNATLDLNKLLNDDASLAAQAHNAKGKLARNEEELAKLMARTAGMREQFAGNAAVQKILEQRNKIGGIFGTVSELGNVGSKYSLALEVAAGNRLNNIVVETDATAAQCIRYLKDNRLGVATFIPLNKIKGTDPSPEAKKLLGSKGVHDFAVNVIKYDPKFKKVFSYVFGSTLVVDDIECARRIGIGLAKMVTLDGDVADISGTMQGGSRQKTRGGGFLDKEVDDSIKGLESASADLHSVIETIEHKRAQGEAQITRLRELKATLEGEIIKEEKSLHLDSSDLEASKQQKTELKAKLSVVDKDSTALQNQISSLNGGLASLKIKKQQLRDKISQLRNPILLAELNTFEQKLQELKERNISLEAQINNLDIQKKTMLAPEKEKIQKILVQHDKEEKEFKDENIRLEQKITADASSLKEKERVQKEFYEQYKGLFNARNKAQESLQKIEEMLYKKEESIRGIEQKMNLLSLENARIKAELAGLEEEGKQYEGAKIIEKPEAELKKVVEQSERELERIGAVNIKALEVYESVEIEYKKLLGKQETLRVERNDVLVLINEVDSKKKDLFMKSYDVLNGNFTRIFAALSTKGEALLELENKDDPFAGGVFFKVRLSGKKFMDIKGLSGGEKTLTALALIFAIQEYEPASFYVFDEVDAALDKRNSEKLAKLVRKYCTRAQYVIISHNDGVISEADNLYGVSMDEMGVSKVVSLKV